MVGPPEEHALTARIARGTLIRDARKAKGWSQHALGQLIGVSRAAVSYWESGTTEISVPNAMDLKAALGIELELLLTKEIFESLKAGSPDAVAEPAPSGSILSKHELSEAALNVAFLWDRLPAGDPSKAGARSLIESAFQAHFPTYMTWSNKERRRADARPKPAKKKKARKPT